MIFFDLDDTLLDTQAAIRLAAIDLHKELGLETPLPDFLTAWHAAHDRYTHPHLTKVMSRQEQLRARLCEVMGASLDNDAADRIVARYLECMESHWALFDDVLPCFERLSAHRFGLISNGFGPRQRHKLEKTGIAHTFACIVISGECGTAKPDKTIFLRACHMANVDPRKATHIGDRYDLDAEGARQAGLRGIWINRQAESANGRMPPTVTSLHELDAPG